MEFNIDKCPRCDRIFSKTQSPVCGACTPLEEADYARVREILEDQTGLTASELADAAEVELACVQRMLDEEFISLEDVNANIPCGRCGGKAISAMKRLCKACLAELDLECAAAMRDLRERMSVMHKATKNEVHEALEAKRDRAETRRAARQQAAAIRDGAAIAPQVRKVRRMAAAEQREGRLSRR